MRHFIKNVRAIHDISPSNRHLLILDSHTSHVNLDVVKIAMLSGLDLLTFPSHTSHALQPLDVTCFKPFKEAFRAYRDKWTVNHVGKTPGKDNLVAWVSFGLKKAFTKGNITKGFQTMGIYPIDATAMDNKVGPSLTFQRRGENRTSILNRAGVGDEATIGDEVAAEKEANASGEEVDEYAAGDEDTIVVVARSTEEFFDED